MKIQQEAKDELGQWFARKPVVALMGEYSAGKSTLLNLLLDGDVLPTKVTATNLPAVWVTHAPERTVEGLRHDGTLEPVDMEALGESVRDDYLLLRLGIPADILTRTDIVDTPGISDPKLAKGATLYLADFLDAVLWLSPANQAWRQTEKTVWSDFPEALRKTSLLVLTRSDKLRRVSDLTKVKKRVTQETADLFSKVQPLNTPLAAASKADPESKNWDKSGGKALYATLDKMLEAAAEAQAKRAPSETEAQPVEPEVAPVPEPVAEPVAAAQPEPVQKSIAPDMQYTPDWLMAELRNCGETVQNFDQIVSLFDHLRAKLDSDSQINPTKRFVFKQCLSAGEDAEANVERLIEQAKFEIADFEKDSWCVIATR